MTWCERSHVDFGFAMPVATAWNLGKLWYRDRLDPDWKPKTADVMRAIFDEAGLTGEFWNVP